MGAIVSVERGDGLPVMVREVDGGSNYLSQNDIVVHFGLGDRTEPIDTISILWNGGTVQELHDVLPNQTLHVVQQREHADIAAVSEWGLIVMSLLILTAGALVCAGRSPTRA